MRPLHSCLRMATSAGYTDIGAMGGYIPIVEIAFRHGMWWSMTQEDSQTLYEAYMKDQDGSYV